MTTHDRMYPSIPDATEDDLTVDLEASHESTKVLWDIDPLDHQQIVRFAAYQARLAASLNKRVAELERKSKLLDVLDRFDKWSARQKPPHFLECYGGVGWTLRCLESIRINLVSTTSLAGELTAWMDEQERKATA